MKNMKKTLAVVLMIAFVATMILPMGTAFAADTIITAPSNDGHSYAVYQIMTGDLAKNAENKDVLSNVHWGQNAANGKNGAVSEADMTAVAGITGTDAEKAAAIAAYVNLESTPVGTVTNGSSLSVPTGYYLIKDNGPAADGADISLYVVNVVGPTTIAPKYGTTTSEKKVKDDEGANTGWNDSADYSIGDAVPFQLKATVASDYVNYNNGYKLTFHDKQDAGLTFNNDAKVYVNGNEIETGFEVVTTGLSDGCTFEVRFANLKNISAVAANSVITVEYTSTLNTNAVIGAAGNLNTSWITYTNNPNSTQAGEEGKTPEDKVVVFTYKVVVNKVTPGTEKDAAGNPINIALAGAEFTLTKQGSTTPIAVVKNDAGTTFTFKGLDAGTYTLTETVTPAGFNTISPITFTVSASHNTVWEEYNTTALTDLSGVDENGVITFTRDQSNEDALTTDVVNKAGSTLPETGGIGTTIFYVVGAVLVIGAGVLLVTRRRMDSMN